MTVKKCHISVSLIYYSDVFVSFDTPQFIRRGWIERNRIAKLGGGFTYVAVPLNKARLGTPINQVLVRNDSPWREKIFAQLEVYKKKAPYYRMVIELVREVIESNESVISDISYRSLELTCEYLGIERDFKKYSSFGFEFNEVIAPDEWALRICQKLGCKSYVNAPGGRDFFNTLKYKDEGIEFYFVDQPVDFYAGLNGCVEPGLSIIDVLMFNSAEEIRSALGKSSLSED